jgi:hypothetical protein
MTALEVFFRGFLLIGSSRSPVHFPFVQSGDPLFCKNDGHRSILPVTAPAVRALSLAFKNFHLSLQLRYFLSQIINFITKT